MRIGVFVGSFDPVHNGHTSVMNYLVNEKIVDKIIVVPTGNYWDKQNITNIKDRLKMLNYISSKQIVIDNKHNNLEYTYQVLDSLEKDYKGDELYLVIGADNANTLHRWVKYDEIIKRGIIVVKRGNIKINLKTDKMIIINKSFGNVSSTMIRNNIKNKKDVSRYLDKRVIQYINENNVYML